MSDQSYTVCEHHTSRNQCLYRPADCGRPLSRVYNGNSAVTSIVDIGGLIELLSTCFKFCNQGDQMASLRVIIIPLCQSNLAHYVDLPAIVY